jgi:hypothetical protein
MKKPIIITAAAIALSAAACSSPPTFSLWRVNEDYPDGPGTPPVNVRTLEMEKGLDRAACELVKQSHVRSAQAGSNADIHVTPLDDGIWTSIGTDSRMWGLHFLCVPSGKRPA